MALGWALLGTGRFAGARAAPALAKAHDCRAIAVISRDRQRGEAFAFDHGIPAAYDNLEAAFADPRIEAVWVASPHALHHEHVLACARARRHVLCEKPLATNLDDAREMMRACQQAGVRLGSGYHLRHHPLHAEARRLVLEGGLGAILGANAEWSLTPRPDEASAAWRWDPVTSGGGIVTGTGVHAIDLLRFVLNDEVDSVSAVADRVPASGEVDRAVVCQLKFAHGTLASMRCYRGVHAPPNDLLLEGQKALLRVHHSLEEQARGTLEVEGAAARLTGVPAGTDLYALQLESFVAAVRDGREPNASGLDGYRATQITTALYESAASGRAIRIDR
jgi:1,5-anhydro-D-fructose reductase (1,5-anhydro-D-mannitol-forming)